MWSLTCCNEIQRENCEKHVKISALWIYIHEYSRFKFLTFLKFLSSWALNSGLTGSQNEMWYARDSTRLALSGGMCDRMRHVLKLEKIEKFYFDPDIFGVGSKWPNFVPKSMKKLKFRLQPSNQHHCSNETAHRKRRCQKCNLTYLTASRKKDTVSQYGLLMRARLKFSSFKDSEIFPENILEKNWNFLNDFSYWLKVASPETFSDL